jgi:tRNA A37 threonylcarbamoyladenosine synthetase subunit TsaC/SUA5/YrdC
MTTRRQSAVFLDRGGTIIEDRGHLRSPADVVFYPDTVHTCACRAMREWETRQPGALDRAAALLRSGGIVAFLTETVYGSGAAVFNETAVAHVFEAKRRPRFDPLIVHVGGTEELCRLVREAPAMAQEVVNADRALQAGACAG